jgi:ubiquinone/menaquinone biosynthesis C-methylase UbiE
MPFSDNSFDLVIAIGVLVDTEGIRKPKRAARIFKEIKRVLKKDGEFHFGLGLGDIEYIPSIQVCI